MTHHEQARPAATAGSRDANHAGPGATLIYGLQTSLDGYTADAAGDFDWAEPDEQVHQFVNDNDAAVTGYLYGRRMYETMVFWETADAEGNPEHIRQYARLWQRAEKVVYSTTLETVSSERTRIERRFDADAVRRMKRSATGPLSIDGPTLAVAALRAGLVDEIRQYLYPVVVGGGTRFLPDDLSLRLELVQTQAFDSGVVYLRYRVLA